MPGRPMIPAPLMQLRQPCFGCQIAAQLIQHLLAHCTGQLEIRFRHGEGDVIAAALMGGLNDQVHIDSRLGEGFKQACGNSRLIGNAGEGENGLSVHFLHPIHRAAELEAAAADRAG